MTNGLLITIIVIIGVVLVVPLYFFLRIYSHDVKQKQHSILRNFPVLGKVRYILEKVGPEFRQYLFQNNNEGRPFNRREFEYVYKAAKYNDRMIGYGSERPYNEEGMYIVNSMFPKQQEEMKIDQFPKINTRLYKIDNENLFSRKEHTEKGDLDPFYLAEDDTIILGKHTVRNPFTIKGFIGQSAMSHGSLGDHAITALSKGLGLAGGTWMNTGEGSVSPYHLAGDVDMIMQVSSGLFGVRTVDGAFSWEAFKQKSEIKQIKAFELKLAQGAKQRGGHVDGKKVTEEIAEIRHVTPWETINSPNRFHEFDDARGLLAFLDRMRDVGGKPVGTKIVIGDEAQIEEYVKTMKELDIVPDFITLDGGDGGSGATYYGLAEAVGLPTFAGLPLLDDMLKKYGLRDRTHIIASGKLLTPDKIVMALTLGADMVNIARGFMLSVGCIMAQVCHTNKCPAGVATTDPKLQNGLSVEEKKFRVCNYLIALRQSVFEMAAVAGIDSPRKFNREHIVHKDRFNAVTKMNNYSGITF
ncbi:FMN-binding glutamate synthase family protein [Lentibacillus cibarius]|uniref:FMN-binding glutamate synthase family protein n=1 Tax=Lentibacillus cibarius TaxID=2583219 RepID=A0A549YBI0_9BACI|nr:FMN-binding glutamate synthase family protein [Lentibacillus cibarius]TRM09245.1 FMN-binding glutamate synthase family protein [Lentibacillus cibarius]TRM11527.1 FMN-binding glutamate synthase family protein [Lentibacillus cibarius]